MAAFASAVGASLTDLGAALSFRADDLGGMAPSGHAGRFKLMSRSRGTPIDSARGKTVPDYCVNLNAQANGDHEVHDVASTKGCLPDERHRVSLGWHATCRGAVQRAKQLGYSQANGCYYCANECNTG